MLESYLAQWEHDLCGSSGLLFFRGFPNNLFDGISSLNAEHSAQNNLPHTLQWCFLRIIVKISLHWLQFVCSASGIHVGVVAFENIPRAFQSNFEIQNFSGRILNLLRKLLQPSVTDFTQFRETTDKMTAIPTSNTEVNEQRDWWCQIELLQLIDCLECLYDGKLEAFSDIGNSFHSILERFEINAVDA